MHDALQLRERGNRLGRVERPLPLPALAYGDLTAVVVDEPHRGVPVLTWEVEGREVSVRAVFLHQLLPVGDERIQRRRRSLDAGCAVIVLAVDDRTRTRVVRDTEELAAKGARRLQSTEPE